MPDKYQISLGIENSQADAAARASMKLMQAYERQCLAAAKAAQNAFNGNGHPGGTGTTQRPGNGDSVAFRKARSGVDLASKEAAAYDKIQERKLRSEEKAADRAAAAQQRDILRSAKSAEQEAARFEKLEERKRLSAEKSAARDAARAEKAAARESAQAEKAAARAAKAAEPKVDIGLHKLQIDSIKATDARLAAEEKNAAQLAAIQDKFYLKDYQAKVKAEKKKEAIDDLARSRTQKAIKDLEGMEESYRVRDYKARVAQEKRKEALEGGPAANAAKFRRKALDDEQAHAVAVNRITDVQNKRKVEGIAKVMGEQRLSFAEAINSALGLESAFTKVAIAGAAIGGVKIIMEAIASAAREARQEMIDLSKQGLDTLQKLKPLASVMGTRATEEFGAESARFGVETGLGLQGGARFREAFRGRAQIVRGRNLTDAEFDKFEKQAAKVTGAKGIPDVIAGDLFGGVAKVENFAAKGQGADQAIARAMNAIKILDAGSGKMEALAPQLNQALAELTSEGKLEGVFRNAGEAAAAISTAAEYNPQEAGTLVSRLSIGLRDFGNKDKQEFFKRAKITPADTFHEAVAKANKVIGEEVAKGVPVDTAIEKLGFSEIREVRGAKTFYGARETVLAPQLRAAREVEGPEIGGKPTVSAAGVSRAQEQIAALEKEKTFRDAQSRARKEQVEYEISRDQQDFQIARQNAEANYDALNRRSFVSKVVEKGVGLAGLGITSGRDILIERRAIEDAQRAAGQQPVGGLGRLGRLAAVATAPLLGANSQYFGSAVSGVTGENAEIVRHLQRIADSNERMENRDKDRQAQAPPALDVKGPAQLSGRG